MTIAAIFKVALCLVVGVIWLAVSRLPGGRTFTLLLAAQQTLLGVSIETSRTRGSFSIDALRALRGAQLDGFGRPCQSGRSRLTSASDPAAASMQEGRSTAQYFTGCKCCLVWRDQLGVL